MKNGDLKSWELNLIFHMGLGLLSDLLKDTNTIFGGEKNAICALDAINLKG